jgi:co-chaperonin GroES (HSP10)
LVEILPENFTSGGGILIPPAAKNKDEEHKLPAQKAVVIRMGAWAVKDNGRAVMPEVAPGSRVIVSQYYGQKVRIVRGRVYRLVKVEDILARVTEG